MSVAICAWFAIAPLFFGSVAMAQTSTGYSAKPIHLIVPFPAGTASDTVGFTRHWSPM